MKARALIHQYWRRLHLDSKYLLAIGLIVIVYVVAARFGLSLAHRTAQVTTVWPPSGIALVVLLMLGYRYWPAIFVGALIANAAAHEPWWVAAGIAAGNTLEAVVGVYLLRRFGRFQGIFTTPREAAAFALAMPVSTLIAAVNGVGWLSLGHLIKPASYLDVMIVWWQGDLMGALVFGSFLLVCLNPQAFRIVRGRALEGGILLATVFAVSILVFSSPDTGPLGYPYFIFPLMIWAALRFTQLGVAAGSMVVAGVAIWAAVNGLGPFAIPGHVEDYLVQLQLFVIMLSTTSLFLAMAITERLAAEEMLKHQTNELERLDTALKEANRRATNILAEILDGDTRRRGNK